MHSSIPNWFKIIFFALGVYGFGDTDTVTWGGDNTRSGYQPNHNLDPDVVAGPDFGQIFRTPLPGKFNNLAAEQIYASPLVYTGSNEVQHVYIATTQNNIYKIDAKTGEIVKSRNLHVPFLQSELGSCVDINPLIGITATGIIDPDTGVWYVTAKTYSDEFQDGNFSPENPPGRLNGRYWQHAINTEDLSEVDGWPVLVDGTVFRNNPDRMFIGGNQHSRPGALLVGDYFYTAYASHCVQYNFTGAIIGFNKNTGEIVEAYAMLGGPEPNTVKGGGIWMSGGGLTYDGMGSMYFSTGNGYASQLKPTGNARSGRNPPTALEEAAVNAKINEDGTLKVIDFFIPWEKAALDGADKDLGTTPVEILPSEIFSCPNHRRIGVVTGKSGKTYWLDLDNLGGYQMGSNGQDAVIQVYQNENSVYAGAGVLPLSGGYVYISVTQYPTHVFKFSCNSAGKALFTKIANTPDRNSYILGTGHGTTTSFDGQEGTGLLWISDVEGDGLRVYDPIPPADGGLLTLVNSFSVPGVTKFSRPVFGDGRVYISTHQGYLYGFGSSMNLPLNCSSPYDFGSVNLGNASAPLRITCTALTDTTINNISLNSTSFEIIGLTDMPKNLPSDASFILSAICRPSNVGELSDDIKISVSTTEAGFSSSVPISLRATGHSSKPVLTIAPKSISFDVIAGQLSPSQSSLAYNFGDSLLTFANASFSYISEQGPYVQPNVTDGGLQVGPFVFTEVPSSIEPANSAPFSARYQPWTPGNTTVWLKAFSDGGDSALKVFGSAGTEPKALIEFQTPDGSEWVPYSSNVSFTFGTVYESQTRNLLMRITNSGGPNAVDLTITVSKPPYGIPGIIGKSNNVDLAEGTVLSINESQTANLYCSVPETQVNTPSYNATAVWILNTGDPDQGKLEIVFFCKAAVEQVGPLLPTGTAQYAYVGCFKENNPGRQLAHNAYSDTKNNTNHRCIEACFGLNYTFAGTQYSQECWCGNAIPIRKDQERDCNFGCTGNKGQTCGGDGYLHDTPHISLFADSTKFDGNVTSPPLQITPSVGNYNFIGCYFEPSGKTLSGKTTNSNVMTVQSCATFCSDYPFFGLEFSSECYCGTEMNALSTVLEPSLCNMPCKGSNSQYCGAASRMQVYQLKGTPQSSSVANSTALPSATVDTSRYSSSISLLSSLSFSSSRSTDSTVNSILSSMFSSMFSKSSTTQPTTTSLITSKMSYGLPSSISSSSSVVITLNSSSTVATQPSSSAFSGTLTSSAASSLPFEPTPTSTSSPDKLSDYTAVGCYNEPVPARALAADSIAANNMTLNYCATFCYGYTFFGAEYGRECYCGNGIPLSAAPATDNRCSFRCADNSSQICGGSNGLSIYQRTPPSFGNPPQVRGFQEVGCFSEKQGSRALEIVWYNEAMTVEKCAQQALINSFSYFGLEYSRECWMGNAIDGGLPTDQSRCNFNCTGNAFQRCGGANYLQMYARELLFTTSAPIPGTSFSSSPTNLRETETSESFISSTTPSPGPAVQSTSQALNPTAF